MPFQVTLTDSRIVFASALANTLNGSSQGDWLISIDAFFPSADSSNERLLGTVAQGASANRVYYSRACTALTLQNNAASSCSWGDFSAHITFDALNNIKIRKLAANTYPDLLINDNLITPNNQGGAWQTVPQFGNLGENFNTFSGLTVSGFSFTDNINAGNNLLYSFDGELASPQIAETVSAAHPSFAGTGTPVWSTTGGGSPTIDSDVEEGTAISIYTGEGLTGTPEVLIDGVSVPYTGTFPNLTVPTDLVSKTAVFHGWDLDAPLVLRVNHDAGGYDNEIIIRSRTGYKRTQLIFPDTGAGTLNSLLPDITLQHNDIVYYATANNTQVNETGYLMTDATSVDILVGKYAENGVFWYPYTVGADTNAPTLTVPTATATGHSTASCTVTTDETGGTLYYLATANATETVATVKGGSSKAVTQAGEQTATVYGLAAQTSYYVHFVHTDVAGNDSLRVSSAQITTTSNDGIIRTKFRRMPWQMHHKL